ncbi:GNAT family N-acetyltransferase [Sulfitobacter sp. JB4-11]|uniref:GNAT family N-acetyltransferase n=1 Tax=Sulfitobacter rhodophyticola TaxID=3238304 RepID=UPI003516C73D
MRVRAARSTDAGAVGAILSEFIDTTEWMPRVHTRAEDLSFAGMMIARGWVSVAEEQGAVVGFAACDGVDLNALYVARQARGRGVGSRLLHAVMSDRKALELWTFEANTGAQRFYARHGFVEVARTDGARNDEQLPDIRYVWKREAA